MCGRYVSPDEAAIEREWRVGRRNSNPFPRRFNVAPTTTVPILRMSGRSREVELAAARWGFVPHWWKEVTGFASSLAAGVGVKAAAASGSAAEFYDYRDCPDPSIANGLFAMSSANFVFGTGPGYSKIQLGGLRSYYNLGDQAYGFDISIGLYLGASAVTGVKIECCGK